MTNEKNLKKAATLIYLSLGLGIPNVMFAYNYREEINLNFGMSEISIMLISAALVFSLAYQISKGKTWASWTFTVLLVLGLFGISAVAKAFEINLLYGLVGLCQWGAQFFALYLIHESKLKSVLGTVKFSTSMDSICLPKIDWSFSMENLSTSQIEDELIAGDELLRAFEGSTLKISEGSKKQIILEVKMLQGMHKSYSNMKLKTLIITGSLCLLMGIGSFSLGVRLDSSQSVDLFIRGYNADANSSVYRDYKRHNDQVGGYMGTGLLLIMVPFAQGGIYLFLRSRSRKYKVRVKELKAMISKAA